MDFSTFTTTDLAIIAGAAVLLIICIAAFMSYRKRKTARLQTQFGSAEYARTVASGGRSEAEKKLEERNERVEALHIHALTVADRARFTDAWRGVQSRFVDGPAGAVAEADLLLGDVMSTRGYPVSNFEQRAADLSVSHPVVLENYRSAHAIALRQLRGESNTEELRQAMVHYRTLFEDLVNQPDLAPAQTAS
jgi:hypothetical protein